MPLNTFDWNYMYNLIPVWITFRQLNISLACQLNITCLILVYKCQPIQDGYFVLGLYWLRSHGAIYLEMILVLILCSDIDFVCQGIGRYDIKTYIHPYAQIRTHMCPSGCKSYLVSSQNRHVYWMHLFLESCSK